MARMRASRRGVLIAAIGKSYRYRIECYSDAKRLKYRLEEGPKGMKVSSSGVIRWQVPKMISSAEVPVIVTVQGDGGSEAIHSFTLTPRP